MLRTIWAIATVLVLGLSSWVQGAWRPVKCPAEPLSPEARFKTISTVATFASGMGTWHAMHGVQQAACRLSLDPKVRHGGTQSLRADYTFEGHKGLEYVSFGPDLKIPKPVPGIGFWYRWKGDSPLKLKIRVVDVSGETHQINLEQTAEPGWHFAACKLIGQRAAWGGDGNHRLDYPCTLHAIVADRPRRGYKGSGSLWIDDVEFVRPRKPSGELRVQAWDPPLGNIYTPGQSVRLKLAAKAGEIRWHIWDYWKRNLANGQGKAAGTQLVFTPGKQGFFECVAELLQAGRVRDARSFRWCVLPPVDKSAVPNEFLGFCTHWRRNAYPPAAMDVLVRYGFRMFRDEVSWSAFEPSPGKYEMPDYARSYLARAARFGLQPLIILDYGNPAYDNGGFPNSDKAVAAFARYGAELAKRTKGIVNSFEVWNEWSGGCGMHGKPGKNTPQYYAKLLRATYSALKAANPGVTVVGLGGEHSKRFFGHIRDVFRDGAAKSMDAFSVHSYRYPRSPEETDLAGEILRVADMAKAEGAPPHVWVTEIGWPTELDPRGVSERVQARYMIRTLALLAGTGVVDRVYWYDFKDDGLRRDYNENNFGVVRYQAFNYAPKPAAPAASVFARLTAGATGAKLSHTATVYRVRFDMPHGEPVTAAWTVRGAQPVTKPGGRALDMMGNAVPAGRVVLTESPVYLLGDGWSTGR